MLLRVGGEAEKTFCEATKKYPVLYVAATYNWAKATALDLPKGLRPLDSVSPKEKGIILSGGMIPFLSSAGSLDEKYEMAILSRLLKNDTGQKRGCIIF